MTPAVRPTVTPKRHESKDAWVEADVRVLRKCVPELTDHTDDEIEALWSWFSTEHMCAGWVEVSPGGVLNFFRAEVKAFDVADMNKAMNYL